MEARNFIAYLLGGITIGGTTSLLSSMPAFKSCDKPYYNGFYEDDVVDFFPRKHLRNMPPAYLHETIPNPNHAIFGDDTK